ncbi:enoyl-CoA hydratase/isomerase family protein [Naumannella halotolerans]|uniref:enoyl-CoA hydratase/isomerase family protein n=1 Tax=Naumannella halotolerans TaxID=993414 RepID=UPI00370D2541
MTEGRLTIETQGHCATVRIDNPRMRNAITSAMWRQFPALIGELENRPTVKVIVIRGAGENFSAGADIGHLDEILSDDDGGLPSVAEEAVAHCSKPVIAAIDGFCIGGGWEIAGACDLRLATDRARFAITPAKLGIIYPLPAIRRLVDLVGRGPAKDLLLTGRMVDAGEAADLGLLTRTCEVDGFDDAIAELADTLARRSQFSIQAMKNLIDTLLDSPELLAQRNAIWQQEMRHGSDAANGFHAFLERREPEFDWSGEAFWLNHPRLRGES